MPVNVEEGIHMETVKPFHRMPFADKVVFRGIVGRTVERDSGTIRSKAAVTGGSAADRQAEV